MSYMHDGGGGWWVLMSIGLVALSGVIIYGIVLFLRRRPTEVREETSRDLPDEILKRRLARGEISMDDYNQLQAAIKEGPPEPVSTENGASATRVT